MPSYAAAHLTGIRTPDGRETEGWFVAAPLLPAQMLAFPRDDVYARILAAIDVGVALGAQVAGLGAFTGVVGDGGVTIAERSPIPVTTGNSLTIAAAVRSLFRGAEEMGIDAGRATAVVVGATGSIGAACVQLIAARVRTVILRRAQRDAAAHVRRERLAPQVPCESALHGRPSRGACASGPDPDRDVVDARRDRARRSAAGRGRVRSFAAARRQPARRARTARRAGDRRRQHARAGRVRAERVREPGTDFDLALSPGTALACMSETMVLALENRCESYTLGRGVDLEKVREIDALADARGFELADMRAFDKAIPPEAIAATRAPPHARRAGKCVGVKKIVSVTLGSSSRDHRAQVELLGEQFDISREGMDGSLDPRRASVARARRHGRRDRSRRHRRLSVRGHAAVSRCATVCGCSTR